MRKLGVKDPGRIFPDLIREVQRVVFLRDMHWDAERHMIPKADFVGICSGGLCLLRLGAAVTDFLHHHGVRDKPGFASMVEAPVDTELTQFVKTLLNGLVYSSEQGLFGLTLLAGNWGDVDTLAWIIRAQVKHPSRLKVLEFEPDYEDDRHDLRERASKGKVGGLLMAFDALISIFLVEAEPQKSFQLLRRAPPVVVPEHLRSDEDDATFNMALRAVPFESDKEALVLTLEALWDEVDMNKDGTLSHAEARELFRLLVSRPSFGLLVRLHVLRLPLELDSPEPERVPEGEEEALDPERSHVRGIPEEARAVAALWCAHRAVLELARKATDVTQDLWHAMDQNQNDTVTQLEFQHLFIKAFKDILLNRAVEEAARLMPAVCLEVLAVKEAAGAPKRSESTPVVGQRSVREQALNGAQQTRECIDGWKQQLAAWLGSSRTCGNWG